MNIETQKHLKDFIPLTNKISELENERRIKINCVIDDFIYLKSHIFNPLSKSHYRHNYRRECEIKYKKQPLNPVSRKVMALVDFDQPLHPNDYIEEKFSPYEILKVEFQKQKQRKGSNNIDEFEEVEREDIDENEKKTITKIVSEINSLKTQRLNPEHIPQSDVLNEVTV
jgi:hypothetical protein